MQPATDTPQPTAIRGDVFGRINGKQLNCLSRTWVLDGEDNRELIVFGDNQIGDVDTAVHCTLESHLASYPGS